MRTSLDRFRTTHVVHERLATLCLKANLWARSVLVKEQDGTVEGSPLPGADPPRPAPPHHFFSPFSRIIPDLHRTPWGTPKIFHVR